jgi:hypothetical protein
MIYDKRLERLAKGFGGDNQNMLVLLHPGEDKAANIAEAKLEHGAVRTSPRR